MAATVGKMKKNLERMLGRRNMRMEKRKEWKVVARIYKMDA